MYMYIYIYVCTCIYIYDIYIFIYVYVSASGVERAYSICYEQQSVRLPQDNSRHFVLESVSSPKYSGTQIITRDSQSNRLTSEDTDYNLSVY